jgi:hypothetical protein
MQVVEQSKGITARAATRVALQDWCGFPKSHDTCNEWLIVNYMVSSLRYRMQDVQTLISAVWFTVPILRGAAPILPKSCTLSCSRSGTVFFFHD